SPDTQHAFITTIPDTWDRTFVEWSPTGRYAALLSSSNPMGYGQFRLDVLGTNGRLFAQLWDQETQATPRFDGEWWSTDGQSLMMWESSGPLWNWVALNPDTGRVTRVMEGIVRRSSSYSEEAKLYALTVQRGDKLSVLLVNTDGQTQSVLVEGADAIRSAD